MKKELLFSLTKKDFTVQTFRGSGPGGQHRNTTDSAVRIIHKASGAKGESKTEKSQHTNKKLAFQRLFKTAKWEVWLNRTVHEITSGKTLEQRVEETVIPKNLKIEVKNENGKWCKE